MDPLLRWLAVDGYGFHEAYFHHPRRVTLGEGPRRLTGYERRAYDQGLGRGMWFVEGADVGRLSDTIRRFAESRRADLWGGAGLACAYAGGVYDAAIEAL